MGPFLYKNKLEMKLIAHNMIKCLGCGEFPLRLAVTEAELLEGDVDQALISRVVPNLDWAAFIRAYEAFPAGMRDGFVPLPEEQPDVDSIIENAPLLESLYRAMVLCRVVDVRFPSCCLSCSPY